jgi:hypothetical protein
VKSERLDVVRGSGNVFRDLGDENAMWSSSRRFSRIRNADLGRFTVDRLMSIINRLGSRVEVRVRVRRATVSAHQATA